MKLLAFEREGEDLPTGAFTPDLLAAEARALWDLQQRGLVRAAHFRIDRHEAVLELEAGSPEEAAAVLATLPLVQAGLITFEVVGLRPYDGTARLFH